MSTKRPQSAPEDTVRPEPSPPPPPPNTHEAKQVKLRDLTITFDEEQLKRFEVAAARFPTDVLVASQTKQAPNSVTIEVPLGAMPSADAPFPLGLGQLDLTPSEGKALQRLAHGLCEQGEVADLDNPAMTYRTAIRWLLDQIADRVAGRKPQTQPGKDTDR